MRRYRVPCHSCDGRGLTESRDEDGYPDIKNCRWCHRGYITFRLTEKEEAALSRELMQNLNPEKRP